MYMRTSIKLALGSALAVPALLVVGLPAGAAPVSVGVTAAPGADVAVAAKLPTSNIITGNKFKPKSLKAAGKKGKACSKKLAGAIVHNKTTASQQLTYNGAAFGSPIPAAGGEYICYLSPTGTPPPVTAKFGLSGSASTLTIAFT
jgi:hypothetical protein